MSTAQLAVLLSAFVAASGHQISPHHVAAIEGALGAHGAGLPNVEANDNRMPSGSLTEGVLKLELRAGVGVWRPEGESGPALKIEAFGEATSPLSVPAPLIRVPAGAELVVSVRNELEHPLRMHGLCERDSGACTPLEVPAGRTRDVRFRSGAAGTYHYWATTTGMPLAFRGAGDTQLSGAFIVDPPEATPDSDRVFVITEWTSLSRGQLQEIATQDDPGAAFLKLRPDVLFLINGRAWPHTERLKYKLSDVVRWRVVNLSTQIHPMHLHGFYFQVDSLGDEKRDRIFPEGQRPRVVTQLMQPGSTLTMTWQPERAGNWLFHCHVMTHVSPSLHVDGSPRSHDAHGKGHHAGAGMTGMVLGVTVIEADDAASGASEIAQPPPKKLTLLMQSEPKRFGDAPAYGFTLAAGPASMQTGQVPIPGPTLVLTRGEPVEITLVNRLPEGTAIHWHGMELESYYDGVHGWSGSGLRVTPLIEPGESFVVRFTPPRTGTFMYHTHLHDNRQLTSGLYGAMLVLEPGDTFDEAADHVFVIGRGGPALDAPTVINGQRGPQVVWKAGARHRIRLINITPNDIFSVALQTSEGPVDWRPLTKDGAPLPPDRCRPGPAKQIIGVGETYDFEYQAPPGRQSLWLEVRSRGGRWESQGHVIVK
jgi:FtsP/CotA-like multicopper oxidase with cupredoxin domain